MGKLENIDVKLFCAAAMDFYRTQVRQGLGSHVVDSRRVYSLFYYLAVICEFFPSHHSFSFLLKIIKIRIALNFGKRICMKTSYGCCKCTVVNIHVFLSTES